MEIIGLDLHKRESQLSIKADDGSITDRRIATSRESIDRCVNQLKGAVGLKEEVAGEPEIDNRAVLDIEIDDNELAARNLELAVH